MLGEYTFFRESDYEAATVFYRLGAIIYLIGLKENKMCEFRLNMAQSDERYIDFVAEIDGGGDLRISVKDGHEKIGLFYINKEHMGIRRINFEKNDRCREFLERLGFYFDEFARIKVFN